MVDILSYSFRYIVNDVEAALGFYTKHFGFSVEMHPNKYFAILARGELRLMLSPPAGPGGGSQPTKDGRRPEPGGWNRLQIQVKDVANEAERLRAAGVQFRSDVITGMGAKLALVADPSGNLVELYELLPQEK